MPKPISHNTVESEGKAGKEAESTLSEIAKLHNFAAQKFTAKPHIAALVRHITREANRHKLDYHQLRYVFKQVRQRCQIEVPGNRGRRLKELPSTEELERFYNAIENPIHRLIFETLAQTGLRISELCSLRVDRIDFPANLIFVHEGKGKKDRVVVFGNVLKGKLELYLEGRPNKFLFESIRNTRFTPRRIEQICAHYREKAAIEKELSPHTFRHLWNTHLAEEGISEERRAVLAGHENSETQKIYTHLSAGGLKSEVIAVLDRISRR